MIEIKCLNCSTVFLRHKSRKAKYCSPKCAVEHRRRKIINDFSVETPESCYWAGFIFGDGCLNKNKVQICLSIKDIDHLRSFSNFVFGTDYVGKYDDRCHIQINNPEISQNLRRYGISENKTIYSELILPDEYSSDFIRGYFDADGWVSVNRYCHKNGKTYDKLCIGICSYLEKNLKIVSELLPKCYISKKNNQELFEIRSQSKNVICDIANKLNGYPRLERKWKKLDFLMN